MMVKSVVGEETRLQFAEERLFLSKELAQVGLLVGKLSRGLDRGFVYDLLPTPPTDDGQPPCSLPGPASAPDKKKTAKGGAARSPPDSISPLVVDVDWVAEHARQVARMLLGGMHVVGIYVWASESFFKASTPVLWQAVREVARAAPIYLNDPHERLLVHASYSPRRWTCRNCTIASTNASTTMRHCDFKWGKLLGSLQLFRCVYKFDQRLPLSGEPKRETFKHVLQEAISVQNKELQSCTRALINGKLVSEDLQLTSGVTHEVELLLPFMNNVSSQASNEEEISGIIAFTGVINASAYLGPKETAFEAISELKGDIINSLYSRLDIICEEASLSEASVNSGIESEKDTLYSSIDSLDIWSSGTLSLPRRVLVPWLGNVFVCDYLQLSETLDVLGSHCREMMSIESPVDTESVVQVEKEATSLMVKSFRDSALGRSRAPVNNDDDGLGLCDSKQKLTANGGLKGGGSSSLFLVAVAILLLGILVGWMITRTQGH